MIRFVKSEIEKFPGSFRISGADAPRPHIASALAVYSRKVVNSRVVV